MVKALIQGAAAHEVLPLASRRLKASREELLDALQGDLIESHRFVLDMDPGYLCVCGQL
jgi:transposase